MYSQQWCDIDQLVKENINFKKRIWIIEKKIICTYLFSSKPLKVLFSFVQILCLNIHYSRRNKNKLKPGWIIRKNIIERIFRWIWNGKKTYTLNGLLFLQFSYGIVSPRSYQFILNENEQNSIRKRKLKLFSIFFLCFSIFRIQFADSIILHDRQ